MKFKSDLETMRGRLTGLIKQGGTKAEIVKTSKTTTAGDRRDVRRARRRADVCSISRWTR